MAANQTSTALLVAAAVAVSALGLWLTVRTVRDTPQRIGHLQAKIDQLQELKSLDQDGDAARGARLTLEGLSNPVPPNIPDVLKGLLPDAETNLTESDPKPLGEGWMLRTVELSIDSIALDPLMRFIATLESERPPWRLQSATLQPQENQSGQARATLTLSALHREML